MDGSTPRTAAYAPLILILAASIGSAAVTAGCLATAARTRRDSENGATTSRSACRRPRSGATGPGRADRVLVLAAVAKALATGTSMGFPLPSAFPPSMGTTGPVIVAGAGLVAGIPRGCAFTSAGLPPTVASTAPVAAPATASRLIRTGTRRLGLGDGLGPPDAIRRQRRPTASANECIESNISPEDTVPGAARPARCRRLPPVAVGGIRPGWRGPL